MYIYVYYSSENNNDNDYNNINIQFIYNRYGIVSESGIIYADDDEQEDRYDLLILILII